MSDWFWFILGVGALCMNDAHKAAKEGRVLWFIWEFFCLVCAVTVAAEHVPW